MHPGRAAFLAASSRHGPPGLAGASATRNGSGGDVMSSVQAHPSGDAFHALPSGYVAIPVSAEQAASPLRICVLVRQEPDSVAGRSIASAKLNDGVLEVTFGA